MPSYRFYFLTADDRIARGQDFEFAGDEAALAGARSLRHAHAIEIWHARRKVGRVEPALKESWQLSQISLFG